VSTEDSNPRTTDLDRWPAGQVVDALLAEDALAVDAARAAGPALAKAVDLTLPRLAAGGRVHYFGAGASGRLAVLDATETTPTFGVPRDLFTAHFPGGAAAFADSGLDLEDAGTAGHEDAAAVGAGDVAVGVTASGSTRYVAGALARCRAAGALTVLVTSTVDAPLAAEVDVAVVAATGEEAVTGSTRLKAGTATKVLLNAFSTALMVRSGRTYSNLMVNLVATNEKLVGRAVRIVGMATGLDAEESGAVLARAGGDVPLALVHALSGRPLDECRAALTGRGVRAALEALC
jgi:N-acetylmuramic acid 6-phosphate etherase